MTTAPGPSACSRPRSRSGPDVAPPGWGDLAQEVRSRLSALPDGGLVELLLPGGVVALRRHGPARVLLALAAGLPHDLLHRMCDAVADTGLDVAVGTGPEVAVDTGLDDAVDLAVLLVRDVLGLPPDAVEVWRPRSPPPPTAKRPSAPGQGRLW